jgi:hypothetical protein
MFRSAKISLQQPLEHDKRWPQMIAFFVAILFSHHLGKGEVSA